MFVYIRELRNGIFFFVFYLVSSRLDDLELLFVEKLILEDFIFIFYYGS